MTVVGVDGCPGGWVAAALTPSRLEIWGFPSIQALLDESGFGNADQIVIDMPIGLLAGSRCVPRPCDEAARAALRSFGKTSSVFAPATRDLLFAQDYRGTGLTPVSAALRPRIAEVDAIMTPGIQASVVEGHPELTFALRAGAMPSKKTAEGRAARRAWLESVGIQWGGRVSTVGLVRPLEEDILDAMALCFAALQRASGSGKRIPEEPVHDGRGLRMEMWY